MLSWFIASFNSETSSFWKSVTRHATVPQTHCLFAWVLSCPNVHINLFALLLMPLLQLSKVPKAVIIFEKMFYLWNVGLAATKVEGDGNEEKPYTQAQLRNAASVSPAVLGSGSGCVAVCHRPSGNTHAEDQKSPILELWQVLPFPSGALEGGLWRNVWLMSSLWDEENMIVHSFLVPSIIFSDAHGESYSFTCNICRTNFQKIEVVFSKTNIILQLSVML